MTERPAPADHERRVFLLSGGALAAGGFLPGATLTQTAPLPEPGSVTETPPITTKTFAEAEKLAGVRLTPAERETLVESISEMIERMHRRQTLELPNDLAPSLVFHPLHAPPDAGPSAVRAASVGSKPPGRAADIAFASLAELGAWLRGGHVTSVQLTELSLQRLRRYGGELECVVTLTERQALAEAERADAELAAGRDRGPLHGIPWGAKDLLDTRGIATTWGAQPYRDRVADRDAAVVTRLREAGAILVAKLTLGALAYGDVWFGGTTRNPWNPEQGSSGSSAGSAAASVAGLVGFAIGTETYGSIVSPCMRCGATGLRPTFGRVPRTGAMALCWSLDKIGPIARSVEDCALVLGAINGADDEDPASVDASFVYDGDTPLGAARVGYAPSWFEDASDVDRAALDAAQRAGFELVEVELPEWPYDTLLTILFAEAASAFDELTRSDRDDELVWQAPEAWPNTFRQTRFLPAIEYIQADRFRRRVMTMMEERLSGVEALLSPSYAASLLLITNCTGHPSLTLRAGFRDDGAPHGVTLWGRLFEEGRLCTLGRALERELGVWERRPPGFD